MTPIFLRGGSNSSSNRGQKQRGNFLYIMSVTENLSAVSDWNFSFGNLESILPVFPRWLTRSIVLMQPITSGCLIPVRALLTFQKIDFSGGQMNKRPGGVCIDMTAATTWKCRCGIRYRSLSENSGSMPKTQITCQACGASQWITGTVTSWEYHDEKAGRWRDASAAGSATCAPPPE
jgi:hypothetical protein